MTCLYREFWIGIDENGFARWLSADPRFSPVNYDGEKETPAHKETIHVREIHPQESELKKIKSESVKNRIKELEEYAAETKSVLTKTIKALEYGCYCGEYDSRNNPCGCCVAIDEIRGFYENP